MELRSSRLFHPTIVLAAPLFASVLLAAGGSRDGHCLPESGDGVCAGRETFNLTRLSSTQVGEIQQADAGDGEQLEMETLCLKPLLFEIKNFLKSEECDHFIEVAKKQGLQNSKTTSNQGSLFKVLDVNNDKRLSVDEMRMTIENGFDIYMDNADVEKMYQDLSLDKNKDGYITMSELSLISVRAFSDYMAWFHGENPVKHSRYSKQVWLFPDSSVDSVFKEVQNRVSKVFQLPLMVIKNSNFQVVRYTTEGHYNAHWDSSNVDPKVPCCSRSLINHCRLCRYMTVLLYLNDVEEGGETAFLVANDDTVDEHALKMDSKLNLYRHCKEAKILVKPERGKAIAWYNHFISPQNGLLGEMDKHTLHGGCPVVRGHKWIGNFWINVIQNQAADLWTEKN